MPSDRSTLTTAEVDAMLVATATSRLMKGKNKVNHLGNVKTPTLNRLRSAMGVRATPPVRGAWKCHLADKRGQKMQSVSGRDIHTFRSVDTLFDIEFNVGRVHLGDEWVHQQIEEAGIGVEPTNAAQMIDVNSKGWWTKGSDTFEVLVNLAEQKLEALELNYVQELNKLLWRSNITDAKLWQGIDAQYSRATNASGPIGNRNKTNPLLRHKLSNISNTADVENALDALRRACNKRIHDGTMVDFIPCGETLYDAVKTRMYSGSAAVTSPRLVRDYDNARSQAQANAAKIGIGLADDALYVAGVGFLMQEPVFEDLDAEDAPAIPWQKSVFFFNSSHMKFCPTKGKDGAMKIHATPYNQAVTRISCYGEYCLMADWFDCHGVAYVP